MCHDLAWFDYFVIISHDYWMHISLWPFWWLSLHLTVLTFRDKYCTSPTWPYLLLASDYCNTSLCKKVYLLKCRPILYNWLIVFCYEQSPPYVYWLFDYRIGVGSLSISATINLGRALRLTTPPVSYAKAADVWLWACIIFVYIAFMEFGVVKVVNRRFDFDSTTAGVSYKFMYCSRGAAF